jgi:CheY-like chemotaxis protein
MQDTTVTAPAPVLPAKALAIEDESYNRIVLANILKKMNYTVDWATTGEEALRLAKEKGYDVIFTDYRLPDTNGVELTREILKLCSNPTPAVFAITAYSTKERREECLSAGMAGFISKPITLDKLRTTLAAWAEGKLPTISLETAQHTKPAPAPIPLPKPPFPTPVTGLIPPFVAALASAMEIAELNDGWDELEQALHVDPRRAAMLAHRLNNICRAHGLIDAAEQFELLEGALERGEPAEPFLHACAPFLEGYCSRATVVNPIFNA